MRTTRRGEPGRRVRVKVRRLSSHARLLPAAATPRSELIQLGGGEIVDLEHNDALTIGCSAQHGQSDIGLASTARLSSLALPPAGVHVLPNAVIHPGSRLVSTGSGEIVIESVPPEARASISPPADSGAEPAHIQGTIALFRSIRRGHFHTLIHDLPRAALLGHAALRRLGPISVVHDGPLSPAESYLLPRMLGSGVHLVEVDPGTPVSGDRVLLPGYVTRSGVGAVPMWYRSWAERCATLAPVSAGPTRIFVDGSSWGRRIRNRAALDELLDAHRISVVDPAGLSMAAQVALFRDAELVLGVHGGWLSNALFSRRARIVEIVPPGAPATRYLALAASKSLAYWSVPSSDATRLGDRFGRQPRDLTVDLDALDAALCTATGPAGCAQLTS